MSKNIDLFDCTNENTVFTSKNSKEKEDAGDDFLPIIPLLKKRPSKNDPSIDKEIRRFNRLIKELHKYEEKEKIKKANDEAYHQLFIAKVIPELVALSKVQLSFVLHLQFIFEKDKFTKAIERKFVSLIVNILEKAAEYNADAQDLLQTYLNKEIALLTKKDKADFLAQVRQEGFSVNEEVFENFDMYEFSKNIFGQIDHEKIIEEQKKDQQEKHQQKEPLLQTSITDLYKGLVKKIHPDLEPDEEARHQKEELMKELTAAKEANDLHAILIIQQKVFSINKANITSSHYSLSQLKIFNKLLKEKVDNIRFDFRMEMFSNFQLNQNSFIFNLEHNADQKVEEELKYISNVKKDLKKNMRAIITPEDLKQWL